MTDANEKIRYLKEEGRPSYWPPETTEGLPVPTTQRALTVANVAGGIGVLFLLAALLMLFYP